MRRIQIEAWVLRVIDAVKAGRPHEDTAVELKAVWPDADQKVARQIAAHANAAGGEPILWVIGVDQERGVVGAAHAEQASWWPAVSKWFNELAPDLIDLNVPVNGTTVVALVFQTDRAPFVVQNPNFGKVAGETIRYEVPWRGSTSTRSATRSELIRLLVPALHLPEIEVLAGFAQADHPWRDDPEGKPGDKRQDPTTVRWRIDLKVYIVPHDDQPLTIPFHRCEAAITIPGYLERATTADIRLDPPSSGLGADRANDSLTIQSTGAEVHIGGAGRLNVEVRIAAPAPPDGFQHAPLHVDVRLSPVGTDRQIAFGHELPAIPLPNDSKTAGRWRFGDYWIG